MTSKLSDFQIIKKLGKHIISDQPNHTYFTWINSRTIFVPFK
jgi:hypothetical protein